MCDNSHIDRANSCSNFQVSTPQSSEPNAALKYEKRYPKDLRTGTNETFQVLQVKLKIDTLQNQVSGN